MKKRNIHELFFKAAMMHGIDGGTVRKEADISPELWAEMSKLDSSSNVGKACVALICRSAGTATVRPVDWVQVYRQMTFILFA